MTDIIKDMSLQDFRKNFITEQRFFDFNKFKIVCRKCNSTNVEFGGKTQIDDRDCYYPEDTPSFTIALVCKCHECGNAFVLLPKHHNYISNINNTSIVDELEKVK